jgi:hypothetical protein
MVGSAAPEVFDTHDRSARVLDDEGDGGESKVATDASSLAESQGSHADLAESAPPDAPLGLLSGSGYETTVRNEPTAPPNEPAEVVVAIAATETDADLETSDDGDEPDSLEPLDSTEAEEEASAPPPTPVLSQAAPEPDDRPGLRFDASEGGRGAVDHEQLFRGLVPDAMTHPEAMKHLLEARQRLRGGALDATAESMLKVAEVHEESRNDEAAARVFRALEHLVPLTPAQLVLWFENASRRGDGREASRVACQMGERALQGGEPDFARDWFQRASSLDPACVSAEEQLRALATGVRTQSSVGPATAVPDPTKLDVVYGVGEVQIPLDEIVDRFQAGVQELVSGDAESQYALGVSFLEMGLAEQAMEALRAASKSPETRGRAAELIGRCLMDLGRFEEAVSEFRASVADASLDVGTLLGVRFELGLALEAAGRFDEALTEFELVHQAQPSYPDAANKIRSLRQSLEQR